MIDRWYSNPCVPENLSDRCVIQGPTSKDLQCYLTKIRGYGTLVISEVKPGRRPKMLISPHSWSSGIVHRRCPTSRAGCHGWSSSLASLQSYSTRYLPSMVASSEGNAVPTEFKYWSLEILAGALECSIMP